MSRPVDSRIVLLERNIKALHAAAVVDRKRIDELVETVKQLTVALQSAVTANQQAVQDALRIAVGTRGSGPTS